MDFWTFALWNFAPWTLHSGLWTLHFALCTLDFALCTFLFIGLSGRKFTRILLNKSDIVLMTFKFLRLLDENPEQVRN